MRIPLVDLKAQYASIKPNIDSAIQRVLDNTTFIMGEEVSIFEREFARFVDVKGAIGVGSGTAALHLVLLACGIGAGDEVITAAHTFIATAEAISSAGARPVFVDIDPRTYCMDPNLVEAAITPRTRAILPVHLYGQPADLDPLLDIANRRNLFLIEDAAQAHGAKYKGRNCGTMGHAACFSFYPGKNLGAYGDAGAITSNDDALLSKVGKLRDHGSVTKYEHDEIGWCERLDALQAAILGAKLPHLEKWTDARRVHAQAYDELLAECDVTPPYQAPDSRHVYHLYVIRTRHRNDLLAYLKSKGIDAGIHYPIPVHKQPAYIKQGYSDVRLPATEEASAEVLSLPMFPELTEDQIHYVADAVKGFGK
jgi:dTDP-4-amino-4,6-dideoxygalactose transaminase